MRFFSMLRFIKDNPKYLIISLLLSILMGFSIVDYQFRFRPNVITELFYLTNMVGINNATALLSNNSSIAEQNLAALQANPHIISVSIFSKNGHLFASYFREGEPKCLTINECYFQNQEIQQYNKIKDDYFFYKDSIKVFEQIQFSNEILGYVYLQSDRKKLSERKLWHFTTIIVIAVPLVLTLLLPAFLLKFNVHLKQAENEIAEYFRMIDIFLSYRELTHLPKAQRISVTLNPNTAICPTISIILIELSQVGIDIIVYQEATNKFNRLAALARAMKKLSRLENNVNTEIHSCWKVGKTIPSSLLNEEWISIWISNMNRKVDDIKSSILQIIKQWQLLITEISGNLGDLVLTEKVKNPYVAGNPVTGHLFVGRDDIMLRLEELWRADKPPSVILYGHRRMGKTSILQNLGTRFGQHLQIIYFNMQLRKSIKSTGMLLYSLALASYDCLSPEQQSALGKPIKTDFSDDTPDITFIHFLEQLKKQLQNQRLLIAIDEFEIIEEGINKGYFAPDFLDFWRGIIQTYPWFVMAFAGLHNLEEMRHDYWHPLFGSITAIRVSFLTKGAARHLITQPDPDFPLDYEADGIDEMIRLTNGQPYLVQLIGHGLVSLFNRQTFEEGKERERRFSLADVHTVIESKEFFRDGHAYFSGVWAQADVDENQVILLKTLAQSENGLIRGELRAQTHLSETEFNDALKMLEQHDVVANKDDKIIYTVELMRRWVLEKVK
jgi:hypothetical protein